MSNNKTIYLNNTATSYPKPKEVLEAVKECINSPPMGHGRGSFERDDDDLEYACRSALAKLFNAEDPNSMVFTSGATEALNLGIQGLDLNNSHVITTNTEHNSVFRPLHRMEKEGTIELSIAECNSQGVLDPHSIEELIQKNTKLIVVNHCSNVTGIVNDIDTISDIAHRNNCYILVDAAQSAGSIPIDVQKSNIDLLAFTGHKSLYGLPGIGGLYIRKNLIIRPIKVGGTGIKSALLLQPEDIPTYYESGTPNVPGIVSLFAGVKFIFKTGIENIHKRKDELYKRLIFEANKIPNVKIYNVPKGIKCSQICSFNINNTHPLEAGYMLEDFHGITVRSGLHCAPLVHKSIGTYPEGTVRASLSYFTTNEEIDHLLKALKDVARFKNPTEEMKRAQKEKRRKFQEANL